MIALTREELEERLAALHLASLELVRDTSLESLLNRIAVLAASQVNARYAAVGVLSESGELEQFIPIGMTQEEISAGRPGVDRRVDARRPANTRRAHFRPPEKRGFSKESPAYGIVPGSADPPG